MSDCECVCVCVYWICIFVPATGKLCPPTTNATTSTAREAMLATPTAVPLLKSSLPLLSWQRLGNHSKWQMGIWSTSARPSVRRAGQTTTPSEGVVWSSQREPSEQPTAKVPSGDKQTDRHYVHKPTDDRQTGRQGDRQTRRQTDRLTDTMYINQQMTDTMYINQQMTDRQADKETGRQGDRQTRRQADNSQPARPNTCIAAIKLMWSLKAVLAPSHPPLPYNHLDSLELCSLSTSCRVFCVTAVEGAWLCTLTAH